MDSSTQRLQIDNTLLFLNLSRKAQVIWKRFEEFQRKRVKYREGEIIGFYPSRDLYSGSTWSVYEVRWVDDPRGIYQTLVWDYIKPIQKGIPQNILDYFEMRPEFTSQSYKPLHYYKTESLLRSTIKKLHPKLSEYINIKKLI